MAPENILRINCTFAKGAKKADIEERPGFILIKAEHKGRNALDIKLVGTDGADAFELKCELAPAT